MGREAPHPTLKDRRVTELKLEVADLVFFWPSIPFGAADALCGGIMHTFGRLTSMWAVVLGLAELCKGVCNLRLLKPQ